MNRRIGVALTVTAALVLSLILLPRKGTAESTKNAPNSIAQSAGGSDEINPATLRALGLTRETSSTEKAEDTSSTQRDASVKSTGGDFVQLDPQKVASVTGPRPLISNLPTSLDPRSALSAGLITNIGGAGNTLREIDLVADWDGKEDMTADRGAKVADLTVPPPAATLAITRSAISEHTIANGHIGNIYYYGDSVGNFTYGVDTGGSPQVDTTTTFNLPALINAGTSNGFTLINPTGGDCAESEAVVTGIAVNPVADLGELNAPSCGVIGEVVYISTMENTGCALNGSGEKIRTRIFAFALDEVGGTINVLHNVRQIARTSAQNIGGLAVDDEGSLYFSLVDLVGVNPVTGIGGAGGAIFKAKERNHTVCGSPSRINRVISDIPGLDGSTATTIGQVVSSLSAAVRLTNYSGASSVFGNVMAMATGANNVVYLATAASNTGAGDPKQGVFAAPGAFPSGLPSMVMTLADARGAFNACSSPIAGIPGAIPIADGIADPAGPGTSVRWRAFVLGDGADVRTGAAPLSFITGTTANTLKVSMQIDPTIYSGLTVNEEGTVFVIAGGTPNGVANNPSPQISEILGFEDKQPVDRRADYVDFRGDNPPVPPASGGNTGDGDSDRFDHIFYQAPNDTGTTSPAALSGLARGFLRYTNRLATVAISPGIDLGKDPGHYTQGDDGAVGPIFFENLDPGHQVAGGDDQTAPSTGDDNDGAGMPALPGALNGGFEFNFGGPAPLSPNVWNAFFLNSNGNISFGSGDVDNTPTIPELRAGPPRIAGAWNDLNPNSRAVNPGNFPVEALGFSNVNAFKIRFINVPEFGSESCTPLGDGSSNTFSMTLFDDGVGIDENANQLLNPANQIGNNAASFDLLEGPTDRRFVPAPAPGSGVVGERTRTDGSGFFTFEYGRMELLGTPTQPVLAGYTMGLQAITNPPGLCEDNLSELGRAADNSPFGVLPGNQTANVIAGRIGEGTEPSIFEFFDSGTPPSIGPGGEIFLAEPDFDLRFEGNDTAASSPVAQPNFNRDVLSFVGMSGFPLENPNIQQVIPVAVGFTPNAGTDLFDALGGVDVFVIGSGFLPNEVTTVCAGAMNPGGIPTERPGKTVSTSMILGTDNENDGVAESVFALSNVVVLNKNLVKGRLTPLITAPGTAFPFVAVTGTTRLSLATTITAGDNNAFGPLVRTATVNVPPGVRAPSVFGVSETEGLCSVPHQFFLSGSNFTAAGPVTAVFAVEDGNPSNVINATSFSIVNNNLIDTTFNFGGAPLGKRFLIFVTGPGGTSRNIVPTAPAGIPLGNERGNVIGFTCSTTTVPDTFEFGTASATGLEGCAALTMTVTRLNPSAGTASVDYSSSDVSATQLSDYEAVAGTLIFGPGETSKTISILINEDSFVEGNEIFNLNLSNPSNGITGGTATVTILDDDVVPPVTNPNDTPAEFVCQQYHDFLNREPDPSGFAFWVNEINSCAGNAACISVKRQNVSAAFFLSGEFQETGLNVLRTQRAAFGRRSDNALLRVPYLQFIRDAQQVGRGVVIGQPGDLALLEANKQAYATQIATSSQFILNFPLAQTGAQYVAALFASAGVVPTAGETTAAVTAFAGGGTAGRVAALRSVADSNSVRTAEMNPSFVLMQYYGYLRRNPTDPPDGNDTGYQFWLTKLNAFGGNFVNAEMVKAFLTSGEYRHRFGP